MTYVYDIYVNFQTICYDFYEWNKKDKITHIKKIPIFQIEEDIFKNILIHENKVDLEAFQVIQNKTEIFKKKKKVSAALLTNNKDIMAVLFDADGKIIKKSFLLLEEENSILKSIRKVDTLDLKLIEIQKQEVILATRLEIERKNFLLKNISNMEDSELIYLYFECFGTKENNRKYIENILKKEFINGNESVSEISYNFLKLICTNS